jgi:hypothetical protein
VDMKRKIEWLSPAFGAAVSGVCMAQVQVKEEQDSITRVELMADRLVLPMEDGGEGIFTAEWDSRQWSDGVYSLFVKVINATNAEVISFTDITVNNEGPMNGIVSRAGNEFRLQGRKFVYAGWNAYHVPFVNDSEFECDDHFVTWTPDGKKALREIPSGTPLTYEQYVDGCMLTARKHGLTVFRTWGFRADASLENSFYKPDGTFHEEQFRRFDYLMDSAVRHGVRVSITLSNYWDDVGGMIGYVKQLGLEHKLQFFTDEAAKKLFKAYIRHFVTRINTVNGRLYKDDPALFSWGIMNEPRMDSAVDSSAGMILYDRDGTKLGAWIEEMASYIKSLDPNHMVTSGSEGHSIVVYGAPWGRPDEGNGLEPVRTVMNQPSLDYVTFHPYPNAPWCMYTLPQYAELAELVVKQSKEIGKPVVMEEWGIEKSSVLVNAAGEVIGKRGEDPRWERLRDAWNKWIHATFRRAGGDGSNVWVFSTFVPDGDFEIAGLAPAFRAEEDRVSAAILKEESLLMQVCSTDWFEDVTNPQDRACINETVHYGWMDGISNRFNPEGPVPAREFESWLSKLGATVPVKALTHSDKPISRIQAAKLLFTALQLKPLSAKRSWDMRDLNLDETDHQQVRALFMALIWKDGEGFRPNDLLTRAEAAGLLVRANDYVTYYKEINDESCYNTVSRI